VVCPDFPTSWAVLTNDGALAHFKRLVGHIALDAGFGLQFREFDACTGPDTAIDDDVVAWMWPETIADSLTTRMLPLSSPRGCPQMTRHRCAVPSVN
jgi:hypothetical protein